MKSLLVINVGPLVDFYVESFSAGSRFILNRYICNMGCVTNCGCLLLISITARFTNSRVSF